MIQLILHLTGDYLTQSDWMAQNKTNRSWPAFCHALVYSVPFFALTRHPYALAVIFGTHFLIDRFRLARYVCWAKNWLGDWPLETPNQVRVRLINDGLISNEDIPELLIHELSADDYAWLGKPRRLPPTKTWAVCSATGYDPDRPAWLAVWLLIIADNTLHLAINYAALRWL